MMSASTATRSRLRRAARALFALVLALAIVALFGLVFLHSLPGRLAVKTFLEGLGSTAAGGTLRLGQLDLALWKGHAAVTALNLSMPGTQIGAQEVSVDWSTAGPRLNVLRPTVVVTESPEPRPSPTPAVGLAARPWLALGRLASAQVSEGRIELRDAEGSPWLVLGRLDATMEGKSLTLRLQEGSLGLGGEGTRLQPVTGEAGLRVEEDALVIERARFDSGTTGLQLDGQLKRLSPTTATLEARAAFDEALFEALAPGSQVQGRVEASAAIEVADDKLGGTIDAATPALEIAGVGPWGVSARGRLEEEQLRLESVTADGLGGRIEAEGPLALSAEAPTEVSVRVRGLDVAQLARALAASLPPVSARASATLRVTTKGWDAAAARGEGSFDLAPGNGQGLKPEGRATLRLEGRAVRISDASASARGASVAFDAELSREGSLKARFSGELPLASIEALAADAGRTLEVPEIGGTLVSEGEATGTTTAPQVTARVRGEGLAIEGRAVGLSVDARYEPGQLFLEPVVLLSGGGQATFSGKVPLSPEDEWDLAGQVDAFELAPLFAYAGFRGSGPATGSVSVSGPRDEPMARASLRASARVPRPEGVTPAGEDELSVELEAHAAGRRIDLPRLDASVAGGRVSGKARYDAASGEVAADLDAAGLEWQRLPMLPASARRIAGTVAGRVALAGTTAAPSGELTLNIADPKLDGIALPVLAFSARSDGRDLSLTGTSGSAAFLSGAGRLEGDWPTRLEIDAAALPYQAFVTGSPDAKEANAELSGTGKLTVELPLRAPAEVRYSSSDLAFSGRVRTVEWKVAPFSISGSRETVEVSGFRLEAPGSQLAANGRAGLAPASPYAFDVEGKVDLASLGAALPERRRLAGEATLKLHVAGTGDEPRLDGAVRLVDLRGRFEGARITDLDADARFQGRELRIDSLQASLMGGTVTASGAIPIFGAGGPAARLAFAITDVDFARFMSREAREAADSPTLLVSLDGELDVEAPSLEKVAARGRLSRLDSKSVEGGTLGLASPSAWSLERGVLEVEPIRLQGGLGNLEARLGARGLGTKTSGEAALSGSVDLRALSPFLPDTTLSGPAAIDVRARYADDRASLDGSVTVKDGRVSLDTLRFAATELDGALLFEGDRARLEMTASSGEGRLRASGGMTLGASLLGNADLELAAERVPLNYPVGFRGRASGTLRLAGEPGAYRLTGDVEVRQGFYTAEFTAQSQSLERLEWQLASLAGGTLSDQIALGVNVRLAEPVRIRNSTASLDVEGAMVAAGTLAQPTSEGVVSLREGGELTIGRGRVRVQEARVTLNDYPAGTPELDLSGVTSVSGIAMRLRARGAIDDLEFTLESDRAELTQTDLVSLLLTGRTASAAASEGGAVLAEQLAVQLGGVLQKGVGDTLLIDVSPERSLLSDDIDPTQRIHIGTRITQNLTVLYSAALDGAEQRWIVEFNPGGGRFRFRAITEEDNTLSFEGTDRLSFSLWNRGRPSAPREVERLASLRFEGSLPLPEQELRGRAKLKPGRRYSGLQHEQAADRVQKRLAETGYRSAVVDVESKRGEDGVELVLRVDPGPLVEFAWSGDDPGGKTRKAAEEAFTAFATPEAAAAQVARVAQHRLQAEGHYGASVEPHVTATEDSVKVALHVARGPKGTAIQIEFDGNEALADEVLAAALPERGSLEFFEALDPRSERISSSIRLAYARVGYLRARVLAPRTSFDAGTGRLDVRIPVRERSPATVAAIQLPEEVEDAGAQAPTLRLAEGQPFDITAYVADRDAIVAWYRAEGWIEARARSVIEPRGDSVSVKYLVEAGPRPRVGSVRVVDSGGTSSTLIRRSLKLREGDLLKPATIAESRERLSDTGIYRSVDVRSEPRPAEPDVRDVVVGLVPRPDVQLEYGLRYTTSGQTSSPEGAPTAPSDDNIQGAAAIEFNNLLGYGLKTRGYTFVTKSRTTWGVTLDSATLVGWRIRTQLFVFDDDADDNFLLPGIESRQRGVTAQQSRVLWRDRRSRRWHDRLKLQWGYTFKHIEYFGTDPGEVLLTGYRGFFSVALIGDERDSFTDPTRGVFWTLSSEIARTGLGSDVSYERLYGQVFAFVPLGPLVWAQALRVGTVPGEDPLFLIENRFRAGGSTTVRGFPQNFLGPTTPDGGSLGGQAVAIVNQELRFPIFRDLKGGIFWDAGNVWAFSRELSFKDLRQSVGVGLRYMFPFGPVRLEYAWVLDRQEGESKGRLVFGLGHAF
jgi:outer membrane protein assembly complex protein YaeT